MNSTVVTRFAPSPTGLLHLGHVYAAFFAENRAKSAKGRFILRIEDIDKTRCKNMYLEAIYEDLAWLGLDWEKPVLQQSFNMPNYRIAIDKLKSLGLIYPCFCTRKTIKDEINRAGKAPHGPDGIIYPGNCRTLSLLNQKEKLSAGVPHVLRLDIRKAIQISGKLTWFDLLKGKQNAHPEIFGDIVIARKDVQTSYHLSVTVDDAAQGVTLVTRGDDLAITTSIHRLLQCLLGYKTPIYFHHKLLTGSDGKKLSKRDNSLTIRSLRQSGMLPEDIKRIAGISI